MRAGVPRQRCRKRARKRFLPGPHGTAATGIKPYPGRPLTLSQRKTTTSPAMTAPNRNTIPQPMPVGAMDGSGVGVGVGVDWGVADGVPGPGVWLGVGVTVGVRV